MIQLLSDNVINKIAAGEVVERPASVIKELVENSIDAKADLIEIRVENAGIKSIVISDNGQGMSEEDLKMAVKRHATSKLTDFDDLYSLHTFGFRGEALPSVASVSKMKITSKKENDDVAYFIYLVGNKKEKEGIISRSTGTEIIIEDLFFNVPARRKFLKTPNTELAHIQEIITKFALIHNNIHFRFISDGKKLSDYPPQKTLKDRIKSVLKRRVRDRLFDFEFIPTNGIKINLFITPPEMNLSDSGGVFLFVNKRPVKDKLLLKSMVGAYGHLLDKGRYPIGVLFLDITPSMVDVNVHPQKTEVRFRNTRMVAGAIRHTVAEALASAPWALGGLRGNSVVKTQNKYVLKTNNSNKEDDLGKEAIEEYRFYREKISNAVKSSTLSPKSSFLKSQNTTSSNISSYSSQDTTSKPKSDKIYKLKPDSSNQVVQTSSLSKSNKGSTVQAKQTEYLPSIGNLKASYIGVYNNLYLLFAVSKGILFVDMHAAHERIRYLTILKQFEERKIISQTVLIPSAIELGTDKTAKITTFQKDFEKLGLELEIFGQDSVVVRSYPSILHDPDLKNLILSILDELETGGSGTTLAGIIDSIAATMACHSAIRKGYAITKEEAIKLLEDLQTAESGGHCPHGRPVSFIMKTTEIAKRFNRT